MTAPAQEHRVGVLEAAAHELRALHAISAERPAPVPVWARLGTTTAWLERARAVLADPEPAAAKAAEWFLDNDYLVQRAVPQIEQDLPASFYERLPSLATGEAETLPRVFALAHGLLRATRMQLSLASAVEFVRAYQDSGALTIAEGWAFPTMLRLACLELLVTALGRLVSDLEPPFAATSLAAGRAALDDTECVARALANLGVIASIPWKDFFDQTNRVEAILNGDPAGVYARMDFDTRDRYRRAVEELARRGTQSEPQVAARVVEQARGAVSTGAGHEHVGYWLVGHGREGLERALDSRPSARVSCGRWLRRYATPLYAVALGSATAGALMLPAAYLTITAAGPLAWAAGLALALLPASVVGVSLMHWLVTLLVPPCVIPKLDFDDGIPPECKTAVVVPGLPGTSEEAGDLLEQLEGHYLANPDRAVQYALLTDFADAPAEHMPGDEALLQVLMDGIHRLNSHYGEGGTGPFHVLHRPRRFNPAEECWMGWERKRGKLEEFNRLVAGEPGTGFMTHEGDRDALHGIRFVVTLDADTRLPPGTVARLAGTLAHPLNRAEFDEATGRVRAGYTVVQPRVEVAPESGNRSLFARLYSGDTSIDIYTRAVSDVYQDLFGTGIYVGKGIYDVDAFRRSLAGRVPEHALASHDLFEGIHGRTALASDIVLYEGFPTGYAEFARRWHRWVRGDWQLLPWLGRRVPAPGGGGLPNRLTALDRWKILDNLRRSLMPPALLALLTAGWLVLPGSAWLWTVLAVAASGAYLFTDLVTGLARGARRGTARGTLQGVQDHVGRWLLAIVFLAHDAAIAVDAIVRTLWRLSVTRRRLLEWTSTAHVAARFAEHRSRAVLWREMWPAPLIVTTLTAALAFLRPSSLVCAAPLLALWFASPEIAAATSRPRQRRTETLSGDERAFLRHIARRTWLFFETFAGPDDHWLPPDNFQEQPLHEVAHRTSPTNVAMMLLSSLTACDLGYLGLADLAARLRNTLETLGRLERYRGHVLNWYDTQSLDPLEPRYVSTVDSGNLAVSLLALKEGCFELATQGVLRRERWDGLCDVLALLTHALERLPVSQETRALGERIAAIAARAAQAREDPRAWRTTLDRLCAEDCPELDRMLTAAIELPGGRRPEALHELHIWLERAHHHLRGMQRDLETLVPWLTLVEAPPPSCRDEARHIEALLPATLPLAEAADRCARARTQLASALSEAHDPAVRAWLEAVDAAIQKGSAGAHDLREALLDAASRAEALALAMDFRFLFDPEVRRFHIGYNVSADRLDPHHYDLFATEARLASFFAVAKRDVPLEHWFFLGRPVTRASGGLALLSWGGSMFEYLLPPLLLRSYPGTLLAQSEGTAVETQRRYADKLGIPWGMSESGFASLDPSGHYRYRAFGVPGLGLRRGLSRDLVVAPYAAALALPICPHAAVENLRVLQRLELVGVYGFYEAADFTRDRVPPGRRFATVRSHMAHHQGMILAAVGNTLCTDALVRRVHSDPRVRAVELLLHERIPRELPPELVRTEEQRPSAPRHPALPAPGPWTPRGPADLPPVHAIGNGRLSTWISESGAGALRWQDYALTRWLPDATRDNHGLWIYVHDEESGAVWSVTRQPTGVIPDEASVVFHPHIAEFHRREHAIAIRMEVAVAPADDVDMRRLTLVNESDRTRVLTLTSYGEVVLAPPLDDERHPAFSKLFVGSEHVPELDALLFTRRPRHPREMPPVLLHRLVSDDPGLRCTAVDADRRAFLGRNGDPHRPAGVLQGLTGSVGWTLDTVMALQVRLEIEPQERRELAFLTLVSGSRESVLELAERYATLSSLGWALTDASADAAREAQRLGLEPERLPELQTLASLLLYPHPALRANSASLAANWFGQPRLWGLGLSGDLPILLLRAGDTEDSALLRTLLRGHQLWRRRGIYADLVVLRTGASSYAEPLRERLLALLQELGVEEAPGRRGGIHLLFADQMSPEECRLVECAARVVLDDAQGSLAHQLASIAAPPTESPHFQPSATALPSDTRPALPRPANLLFDNGLGGFTEDGREYVIHLEPGESTPAPWSNVLANEEFGCVVTEAGGGFTWAGSSGENRLTPWTNDPLADPPGEALYLRDEETAEIWTPTPRPAGTDTTCQIRHGAGYTEWTRQSHGFEQRLLVFVPTDDPVKIARLRLRNLWPRARRITATYYAEWLLGALRSVSRPFVVVDYEQGCHALFARNSWNPDFAGRVAFLASSLPPHGLTTDRAEFLGREGDLRKPAGLQRWGLSGRVESGGDPCAAFQVHIDVGPEETAEVVFILGQGRDRAQAEDLVRRWQVSGHVERAFEDLGRYWDRQLGAVQVRTPDKAFDLMVNRWLLYQAIASRIMARAGFYQAGGAIGFRDQLQDVLALLWADPARTRAHILACAARQFDEGDVLHWWHPSADRGVRTRCSDDLLWLPYATSRYVEATGDDSILDEEIPFLHAPPLEAREADRYARFETAPERRSLFEHCARAVERGVTRGAHGLPLIGSGDWNDGMDRVGCRGRGESVWLAWLAIAVLHGFADLCVRRGEHDLAARWQQRARDLQQAAEKAGWDGEWYLRAFDDDGRPWGSQTCDECRIDSVAQSWSVLSGAGTPEHARRALESAERELVRDDEGLIRLLWPPFDLTPRDPGYIKAYPPGIRENGGQYSHAAAWLGWALAELGDGDRAARIFALLNPIRRAGDRVAAERHRVEPYVLAADVGAVAPHVGRGGWTWYTGSAAWAWRLGVEAILGLRLRDGRLVVNPCLPAGWHGFEAQITSPAGNLAIRVENLGGAGTGVAEMTLDGEPCDSPSVAFPTDGSMRRVEVRLDQPPAGQTVVRSRASAR